VITTFPKWPRPSKCRSAALASAKGSVRFEGSLRPHWHPRCPTGRAHPLCCPSPADVRWPLLRARTQIPRRVWDLRPLPTDLAYEPGKPSRLATEQPEPCVQEPVKVGRIELQRVPPRAQQAPQNPDRVASPWRCAHHLVRPPAHVPKRAPRRPGPRNPRSPRRRLVRRREPKFRLRSSQ
jgi:hypothetical protein